MNLLGFREISAAELRRWQQEQRDFQLIDVRESHEHAATNLGGTLMPLGQLEQFIPQIATDRPVVVYCQSGARSQRAVRTLVQQHGFLDVRSLVGGLDAWEQARKESFRPKSEHLSKAQNLTKTLCVSTAFCNLAHYE